MSFPDHPVPEPDIAAFTAPVPKNSGIYMQCTGMNSGVGGHTAINEVCVCVCRKWEEQTGKTVQQKEL